MIDKLQKVSRMKGEIKIRINTVEPKYKIIGGRKMDGMTFGFINELKIYFENTIEEILDEKLKQIAPKEIKTEKEWLKQKEVCKHLSITYNTLQKFRVHGLKVSTVEGITLVSREEINRFLKANEY